MKQLIANTLLSWCFGMMFGLFLGFGNIGGMIYYDIRSGLCVGAILGCAFAIACWIVGCESLGENND